MIRIINRNAGKINAGKRALSRGALPGGFTEEGLQNYAKFHWKGNMNGGGGGGKRARRSDEEDDGPDEGVLYTDLFSHKISPECSGWLDSHEDPSGALGKAFFGSPRFIPERIVMSPLFYKHTRLLDSFKEQERFLAWKVISKSPLELICEWNLGNMTKGLTMLAFDPPLRRIYHGNCVDRLTSQNKIFEAFIPLHDQYANYLLRGMGDALEKEAQKQP